MAGRGGMEWRRFLNINSHTASRKSIVVPPKVEHTVTTGVTSQLPVYMLDRGSAVRRRAASS